MELSDNTSVSMPMRNLISILASVAVGAWFGFGVIERLNIIEVELQLMQQMESEIPMIQKNDMTIQFHEERLISLEEKQNGH